MHSFPLMLLFLAASPLAALEPPAIPKSMMSSEPNWTIRDMKRDCVMDDGHDDDHYHYDDDDNDDHDQIDGHHPSWECDCHHQNNKGLPKPPHINHPPPKNHKEYQKQGDGHSKPKVGGLGDDDDDDEKDWGHHDNRKCSWSFGIETDHHSRTECAFTVRGRRSAVNHVRCGHFAVSSGWSGQFGPSKGFTTLSVVDEGKRQIIWPAYTDEQLKGGRRVKPDQSYAPAFLP